MNSEEDKLLIGKKIKEIRVLNKLTQEQFSDSIGIEPSSLSNIETGKSFPSLPTILNVISTYKVNAQEFFSMDYAELSDKTIEKEMIKIIKSQNKENKKVLYRILREFAV